MFRYLLLGASLFAALCAPAQARIHWLETSHNFGAFDEDQGPVTCQMKYVNTGDEPLVIIAARASCGCTSPRFEKTALAPGDTAAISVTYDPSGRPGRFSKKITIDTNTEPQRSSLTISGVVIGSASTVAMRYPVDFGPLKMSRNAALLGTAKKMHARTVFIDGYNRSSDTIAPIVRNLPEWLDVTPGPRLVAPGERVAFNFLVRADNTPLYGLVNDTVTFVPDSRKPDETYAMPVVVTLEEDFARLTARDFAKAPVAKLAGDRLEIGEVQAGQPYETAIELTNDGKSHLLIRRIYTADHAVRIGKCPGKIKPGKTARIPVTLIPTSQAPVAARIVVITNDPVKPTQTVVLTADPR